MRFGNEGPAWPHVLATKTSERKRAGKAVRGRYRKKSQAGALIDRVIQHFGRLDVLVNDVGDIEVAPMESLTSQQFEHMIQLMFRAPLNLTLAALPHMKARRSGTVVNIASVGGRVSIPHLLLPV